MAARRLQQGPALIHQLPGDLESPGQARSLVGQALLLFPDETMAVAQLLTSELVTKAVVHARCALDLLIELAEFGVRISVADSSGIEPERRAQSVDGVGGRGLALVEVLASRWGWERVPGGKRVWFELPWRAAQSPLSGRA
jgi:anti-sigma regulatory factor (Ser/Thr protein kinase)